MASTGGKVLIVSGPSGSGKSTLVERMLQLGEFPLAFSVSATSRPPRPGETDGVQYRFVTPQQFVEMTQQRQFLEHAHVHGNHYGTLREPVAAAVQQGKWVILEIDVQGFLQVQTTLPDAVSFFIRAPSIEGYAERLRQRNTESDAVVQRRIEQAKFELQHSSQYTYQIVNETVEQAVRIFRTLLLGLKHDTKGNA